MSKIQTTWRKLRPAALAAALCGLGAVTDAQATLMISYSASANGGPVVTATCVDNNLACDTNPTVGIINLGTISPIAGLTVNGSTQISTQGPLNVIQSGSAVVSYTGPGTVHVVASVSDTSFIGPATLVSTSGSGTFTNAAGSSIDLFWFNDPANAQGAETPTDRPGNLVDTFSYAPTLVVDSFSHTTPLHALAIPDPGLFSMTLGFEFDLVSGGSLTSRGMNEVKPLSVIPEPGMLLLLGSALIGLAAARRKAR